LLAPAYTSFYRYGSFAPRIIDQWVETVAMRARAFRVSRFAFRLSAGTVPNGSIIDTRRVASTRNVSLLDSRLSFYRIIRNKNRYVRV